MPITFLRQFIRFYGDSMQMLVPRYLEQSMHRFTREQEKFREQMAQAFGGSAFGPLEEHVRRNMELFEKTFAMFTPFARGWQDKRGSGQAPASGSGGEMDELKRQLEEMQKTITGSVIKNSRAAFDSKFLNRFGKRSASYRVSDHRCATTHQF